jgi:hypothetical protein
VTDDPDQLDRPIMPVLLYDGTTGRPGHQCPYDASVAQTLSSTKFFQHLVLSIPEFIGHLHPVIVHLDWYPPAGLSFFSNQKK